MQLTILFAVCDYGQMTLQGKAYLVNIVFLKKAAVKIHVLHVIWLFLLYAMSVCCCFVLDIDKAS